MRHEGKESRIVWKPNSKPQALFLSCPYPELLFGGSRGPGKTDSLLMSYLQHVGKGYGRSWVGIIFRHTYKQLEEIISKSNRFFPRIIPGAQFHNVSKTWEFPDGETLKLRHAKRPVDMENYQGHEYPFVGFDELCNIASQEVYEKAKAFCRSSNPKVPKIIRATANPLGPGHLWVKRYFIDPAPPLTPIISASGEKRAFIPATIYDNKNLLEADPRYVASLESISDDNLRRAWLDGDWNVVAGAFFGDVWTARNVLKPFATPKEWYCFRSFDWGSSRPFSVGWWAISDGNQAPDGHIYPRGAMIRIAEWYGAKKDVQGQTVPNEGLRMSSKEVAKGIRDRENVMRQRLGISIQPGPADPAIYASDDGPSVADNMATEGVTWVRADNSRLTGWQQMRERIWGEDGSIPMLYVFDTCLDTIRTLPAAPRDERIPDDIDTEFEDHCIVGDTLVWTDIGPAPIRELVGREGRVFGDDGKLHRFHNARRTREGAEVVRVTFEDGTSVVCTADHKILTEKGFVEASRLIDETGYATFLSGGKEWNLSSSMTPRKVSSEKISTCAETISSGTGSDCISPSGRTITEKFQKAFTSTIKTETGQTIASEILSFFRRLSIWPSTKRADALNFQTMPGRLLRNGTGAMKAGNGISSSTKNIVRLHCQSEYCENAYVAERNFRENPSQNSAQIIASQNIADLQGQTWKQDGALYAGQNLAQIATEKQRLALSNAQILARVRRKVLSVEPAGVADVYCLDVEDVHCFAVNGGVIVHNCLDEIRYACMYRRRTMTVETYSTVA